MQTSQLMFPLIIFGAFGAYAVWMMSKRKKALQTLGPAFRRFFEQTGYRYAEIPQAPIEDHVKMAEAKTQQLYKGGAAHETNYVRDYHGAIIHHRSYMGGETRGLSQVTVMSCTWTMPVATPPRVLWQIADKSLTGFGKALKEAFSNTTRNWKPAYPTQIETGDPELDKRFVVFGTDPDAVRRALAAPGLKQLLVGCTEVDLCVRVDAVTFSDPFQKNIRAGMGGTIGAMAAGFDYARFMDSTIPIHDRISSLLATAARASLG
jgi:hypothetical protein